MSVLESSAGREYEPIWIKLKKRKECYITAPKELHARIVKAVIKEKYNDHLFKLDCAENCKKARISYQKKGNIIFFKLNLTVGLDDL